MSPNRVFWLVLILFLITAVGLFIVLNRRKYDRDPRRLRRRYPVLKQGDDRSRDCEVFNRLSSLASDSKAATETIGEMYARAMCQPFDLEKSIQWFEKAGLSWGEAWQRIIFCR